MKKILHIISSPRGDASLSIKLGHSIIDKIQAAYPGSTVYHSHLIAKQFPHLEEAHLASFFTPAEIRTPGQIAAIKHSDDAIAELNDADIIVIGAPVYNFNIHSALKAWIDHIVRAGVTFKYGENGPEGLIKGKKIYIALASGAVLSAGEMQGWDYAIPYLKTILSFIGLSDITVFRIEGTAIPGIKETAVEKGLTSVVID